MKFEIPQSWLRPANDIKMIQPGDGLFANDSQKTIRVRLIINVFYFIVFTTSVQTFSIFYQFPDWSTLVSSRHLFEPLWSSRWMLWFEWETAVRASLMIYFGGSLLALAWWERWRWVRVIAFIAVLQYLSLISSFGKIDHYMHLMVIVTFMLIFLPDRNSDGALNQKVLKIVLGIQSFILLIYFISGSFKLLGIVTQTVLGQTSALSPDALAQNVAKGLFTTNAPTFFSSLILEHPSWMATVVLLTGYMIEACSIFIISRPNLHRVWGMVLLVFHSTILMTVGPDFTIHMVVVGLFLVFSPFSMER
jgi:hypothetical protein